MINTQEVVIKDKSIKPYIARLKALTQMVHQKAEDYRDGSSKGG